MVTASLRVTCIFTTPKFGQGLKHSICLEIILFIRGLGMWGNKLFKGKDMSRKEVTSAINNISLDSRRISSAFNRVTFWSSTLLVINTLLFCR